MLAIIFRMIEGGELEQRLAHSKPSSRLRLRVAPGPWDRRRTTHDLRTRLQTLERKARARGARAGGPPVYMMLPEWLFDPNAPLPQDLAEARVIGVHFAVARGSGSPGRPGTWEPLARWRREDGESEEEFVARVDREAATRFRGQHNAWIMIEFGATVAEVEAAY